MQKKPYKNIIVKIGTNVIVDDDGLLNEGILYHLVEQVVALHDQQINVIIVSSGAVGAGRSLVKVPAKTHDVVKRQILSSVGQIRLLHTYLTYFQQHQKVCAQVLVTREDFRDRQHYLNMRNCLQGLIAQRVVPIVNENDVIAVDELMFTDNDELAGLIASMVQVDALILLTSVDGIFDGHPRDENSKLISVVDAKNSNLKRFIMGEKSAFGRGGMLTKTNIASKMAAMGINTHIANGRTPNILLDILQQKPLGTQFLPLKAAMPSSLKRWIIHHASAKKATVYVNDNAELALKEKICSLLPIGIVKIDGDFEKGDIVHIRNLKEDNVGFGMTSYNSQIAKEYVGQKGKKELIHYDHLVIEK